MLRLQPQPAHLPASCRLERLALDSARQCQAPPLLPLGSYHSFAPSVKTCTKQWGPDRNKSQETRTDKQIQPKGKDDLLSKLGVLGITYLAPLTVIIKNFTGPEMAVHTYIPALWETEARE